MTTALSFEELAELDVGDIIYECDYGQNAEVQLVTLPVIEIEQNSGEKVLKFMAKTTLDSGQIEYYINSKFMHYAPKLYKYPAYS